MGLYLAGESSLALIRYLRSVGGSEGVVGSIVRKRTISDAANTVRQIQELDETAQGWLRQAGDPIVAFVPGRARGTSTKHLVTHVFGQTVPYGAFLDLGHNVCISSPQYTFTQVAAANDLVGTVVVGMELCGHYSKWRLAPSEMGDPYFREHKETQTCTFDLPPAMKVKRAQAFVQRASGLRGTAGAKAALKWVLENSASPMETAVYLLLCLPKRLGGYGLPKPVLNPKVMVSNPDGVKERYPDLFWIGKNIDVEYNSDAEHSGEWSRYRDSKREIELTVGDVKVLPLTRPQLMSASEFDAFAQGLRRMLGVRSQGFDEAWLFRRDELRSRLLGR